jgi:L-alanine-DL-glutamate epimerase-like enolase superfamily enzyme
MQCHAKTIQLDLLHPFRISREVSTCKENVLLSITDGEKTGLGEAAPSAYYGENATAVHDALARVPSLLGKNPFDLEDTGRRLQTHLPECASARAAVDIALHDLAAQRLGIPLYQFFGLNPDRTPTTSFTIAIDKPDKIRQKVHEAAEYPALKVKLGSEHDLEIMRTIREESDAKIRVDANAGWSVEQAIYMVQALAEFDVEFVEQPLPPDDLDGLRQVRAAASMPIIVDESVLMAADVPRLADCVDGVNLKLMKCGGLREALRLIHTARAHGLLVMIGCMIETSVAITAAAHLTPLVDYADLDGHLLIANDPYTGVTVQNGRLILPEAPGLGIKDIV